MTQTQKPVQNDTILITALSEMEDGLSWADVKIEKLGSDAISIFQDKTGLYRAILMRIDNGVEAQTDRHIIGETPRDRLFEILMLRFDVLNEYGKAYRRLFYEAFKDPHLFRAGLPCFHASMEMTLRLADLNARDGKGFLPLRTGAIALVYLNAVRVWLGDDTPDMSKTMAELDRGLARLDDIIEFIPSSLRDFV